jgi:HNH endonuclease
MLIRDMTGKLICIFCDSELTSDTKPEHILLNALGGRKTTQGVICSKHNNEFGGTIDNALTEEVNILRNLLQFESGTGKAPPRLKNLQAGSERVHIGSDGRPELSKPPFTVAELPDGAATVQIHAQTPEAIERMLPHLAAKLRIPEDQLIEHLKNGHGAVINVRPGQLASQNVLWR